MIDIGCEIFSKDLSLSFWAGTKAKGKFLGTRLSGFQWKTAGQ